MEMACDIIADQGVEIRVPSSPISQYRGLSRTLRRMISSDMVYYT
jgi:hypothetical protein